MNKYYKPIKNNTFSYWKELAENSPIKAVDQYLKPIEQIPEQIKKAAISVIPDREELIHNFSANNKK